MTKDDHIKAAREVIARMRARGEKTDGLTAAEKAALKRRIRAEVAARRATQSPQEADHGTLADKLKGGAVKPIDGDIRAIEEDLSAAHAKVGALELRLKVARSTKRSWERFEREAFAKEMGAALTMTAKLPPNYEA